MLSVVQRFWEVGDCICHHRHRGDAKRELAWIDLVERVGLSVVNVEIVCSIDIQACACNSLTHDWTNVSPTAISSNTIRADA